jgi:neutral ceramidase
VKSVSFLKKKIHIRYIKKHSATMAGRRLRESTLKVLINENVVDADATIILAGLSNTYSSYVTTREEYQIQRVFIISFLLAALLKFL